MTRFVSIQVQDDDVDHINVDHIVRVHAEAINAEQWVLNVTMSTGMVLVDSRHGSRSEVETRVAELLTACQG